MNPYFEEAKGKIQTEHKSAKYDQRAKVMAPSVVKALVGFCEQDAILTEKVAHGRSFEECMAAVAKNVGSSLSDLEAYRRAVKFYDPEADVRFAMNISRGSRGKSTPLREEKKAVVKDESKIIDLEDFL